MTDPRNDPRPSDPVMRRPDSLGGMWGWIAGIAVLVLIAIILIAGWNSPTDTASTAPVPEATTGNATAPISKTPLATMTPASTTGSAPAAPTKQ